MSMLLNSLAQTVTREAKKTGFVIHRRLKATYSVIFGIVEVSSPYLWNKREHRGSRPVKEKLLIEHGERSIAVKRALTDFGAEESFGQAAKRFQEHYGWKVERSSQGARSRINCECCPGICRKSITEAENKLQKLDSTV